MPSFALLDNASEIAIPCASVCLAIHSLKVAVTRLSQAVGSARNSVGQWCGERRPHAKAAKIICGRPPRARAFEAVLAIWSGAVICPALRCGASDRWPWWSSLIGSLSRLRAALRL